MNTSSPSQATIIPPTVVANNAPALRWNGQARVGWLSTQGPFGNETLAVSEAQLRLTSRLGDFCFSPQTVERVVRAGFIPWFWTGLQIHHRVGDYPRHIGFCPRGIATTRLLQELARHGYRVT